MEERALRRKSQRGPRRRGRITRRTVYRLTTCVRHMYINVRRRRISVCTTSACATTSGLKVGRENCWLSAMKMRLFAPPWIDAWSIELASVICARPVDGMLEMHKSSASQNFGVFRAHTNTVTSSLLTQVQRFSIFSSSQAPIMLTVLKGTASRLEP